MEGQKYSFEGKVALVMSGVKMAQREDSKSNAIDTHSRTYAINNPIEAIALSYYNASNGSAAKAGMFAKRALEICGVQMDEVEALMELSIYSNKDVSSIFKSAANQIERIARKEFLERVRRIEEPFQTD